LSGPSSKTPRIGVFPLGVAALAAQLLACQPTGPETTRIVTRLIDPGNYRSSASAVFFDTVEVERWEFNDDADLTGWTNERIDTTFEVNEDGLLIESTSTDPTIFRPVDLPADRVKAIRVSQSGLTSDAYMQLYWATTDRPSFSESRTVGCSSSDPTGALVPSYTFRVRDHHEWSGDITMIRLDPTSVANRIQQIHSITALDFIPTTERIAGVAAVPWRVDIHGDVRTALLTPPGHAFTREFSVPRRAALRFAQATETGIPVPVTFRIVIEEGDADDRILHETTVEPCRAREGCGWHEAVVDLSDFGDRTIRLRFETESEQPLDPFHGFPAWAGLEVVAPSKQEPPPNVILVVLDTLRSDSLSLNGYSRETSPNLDTWAASRAIVFDNVVAPAPWTLPSHVSIFTGLDALTHGVNTGDPMPSELLSMAELLRENGYTTHAATGGAYLTDHYGVMQGFDSYRYYRRPMIEPAEAGNDLVDGIDHSLDWLEKNTDRPFFLFFHTYEIHTPYRAREPYFSRFHSASPEEPIPPVDTLPFAPVRENGYLMTAGLKARFGGPDSPYRQISDSHFPMVRALYDSGVAFTDLHLKRLFDHLEALDIDEETVVIITSDHGESLGERGKADHKSLEDWELLVPLVIAAPSAADHAGRRVSTQVRLIDLFPTVLDLVGLRSPEEIDGRSLLPLIADPSVAHPEDAWSYASSSNFGIGLRRAGRLKYTFNNSAWVPIHGLESLYRLDSDPATETDVAATDPETAGLRRETAETYLERTSGVRVRFANRLAVPMEGHLKGHIVQPLRIKTFGLPTDDVEWRYQMINFSVPGGETMDFFIEGIPFGEVYVTGRFDVVSDARTGFKKVVRLENMSEPWQIDFDGRSWGSSPAAGSDSAATVRLWIHGDRAGIGAPAEIDDQSRELLKKLGYIH
jgi:arylsulfatase A-like enzyme